MVEDRDGLHTLVKAGTEISPAEMRVKKLCAGSNRLAFVGWTSDNKGSIQDG